MEKGLYKSLVKEISQYTSKGMTKPQAISLIAKKHNLNPYEIMQNVSRETSEDNSQGYKDVKTEQGSFVTLKNDKSQKHYEVININSKDAVILRDVDSNKEIIASENELTPVVMENSMSNINEAQYNVSINGLESQDAEALSQMLSLAGRAENNGENISSDVDDISANPMPMDMDNGMPMDMADEMPKDGDTEELSPREESEVDDVEFDEELPMDTDIDSIYMDAPEDFGGEIPGEEPIEDMTMDDMMDDGMFEAKDTVPSEEMDYDDERIGSDLDDEFQAIKDEFMNGEADDKQIKADLIAAGYAADDESAQKMIDEWSKDKLIYDDFDDEIAETLKIAGIELNKESLVNTNKPSVKPLSKKVEEKGPQEPNYKEVDTNTFGQEASEGDNDTYKITCESTVNEAKIKSIYETAKSMYSKKPVSEWNGLDRRYVEKLIKEGCSYKTSCKLLMEAKKGK